MTNKNINKNQSAGVLSGVVGIFANIILCISKIVIGIIFGLISITADGINNLSDSGSSIISVIAYKASGKPADDEHPFGHARIEYILSLVIGISIIIIGIQLAFSSIQKIITPEETILHYATIIVLVASILIKLFMAVFNFILFRRTNSLPLKATAIDSLTDIIATSVILITYLIAIKTGVALDGYAGVAVSLIITYSGIKIIKESFSPLLGEKPCTELVNTIYKNILNYDGVLGLHDLTIHNYGPDRNFASVHVEVDSEKSILESHDLIDNIENDFKKMNINLVIHMDPIVLNNPIVNEIKQQITDILANIDTALSMHDFRVALGTTHSNIIFDLVIPSNFNMTSKQLYKIINQEVISINPNYKLIINFDHHYL